MILPPKFEQLATMFSHDAQRSTRLAHLHASVRALSNGIEPHDEFTRTAKDVHVRPVSALVAQVYVDFKAAYCTLRHIYPIRFGYPFFPNELTQTGGAEPHITPHDGYVKRRRDATTPVAMMAGVE
jgi:hypothetical protein